MTTTTKLVAWCRSQVGTPWVHHGRAPGEGLDCVGLAVCALRATGLPVIDDLTYSETPSPSDLLRCVMANCRRVVGIEPARLALFWIRRPEHGPTHAAVFCGDCRMIHAHRELGGGRVQEVVCDSRWIRRLHSVWEYDG